MRINASIFAWSVAVLTLALGAVPASGKQSVLEGEFPPPWPKDQRCLTTDDKLAGQAVYWARERKSTYGAFPPSFKKGREGSLSYSRAKVGEYGDYDIFEEKIRWRRTKGRRLTCVLEENATYGWGDVSPDKRYRLTLRPAGGRKQRGTWTHHHCHVKARNAGPAPDYSILYGCWDSVLFYLPKSS